MAKVPLSPFTSNVEIVTKAGLPTQYFYNWMVRLAALATAAGVITSIASTSLTVTNPSGPAVTIELPNVITPGSFTSANITVDAKGRVTAAANGTGGVSSVTGTANQIAVSPTTGAVVVSLPLNILLPNNSSSPALTIQNADKLAWKNSSGTTLSVLQLFSDNSVYLDSPAGGNLNLRGNGSSVSVQIQNAGNVVVNAPTSGTALTVNGVGGAVAQFGISGLTAQIFLSGGEVQFGSLTNSLVGFYVNNGAVALQVDTPNAGSVGINDWTGTIKNAGFREVPQKNISGAYTPVLSDSGKYLDAVNGTAVTLPTNAAVPYPMGTVLTLIGDFSTGSFTIAAGAGETLFWAGQGSLVSGTRTGGVMAVVAVIRISTSQWVISGAGIS